MWWRMGSRSRFRGYANLMWEALGKTAAWSAWVGPLTWQVAVLLGYEAVCWGWYRCRPRVCALRRVFQAPRLRRSCRLQPATCMACRKATL